MLHVSQGGKYTAQLFVWDLRFVLHLCCHIRMTESYSYSPNQNSNFTSTQVSNNRWCHAAESSAASCFESQIKGAQGNMLLVDVTTGISTLRKHSPCKSCLYAKTNIVSVEFRLGSCSGLQSKHSVRAGKAESRNDYFKLLVLFKLVHLSLKTLSCSLE